jgi:Flp pilus assembly protein TadD
MPYPSSALQRRLACAAALVLGGAWAPAAWAQAVAQPVVQPLPDPATQRLNEALRTLSRDPRSPPALIAAAEASLALDDVDAALGFIQRAEAVAPADGRVMGARASWLVRQQQPVEALRLFAEAERQGALSVAHIGDRGLAYDLVGDNARAQRDYTLALSAGANPAISRRLALSQAISGDQRGSEATLLPLLQRSDLAAYRTRAFALAILGKSDEAVSIAETMLPARLSSRLGPYLRYMPRLTRSQQAAAANLGVFPQAAQIGRDEPAVAAYGGETGASAPARTAGARLVPSGEPLGSRSTPIVRAAVQPPQTNSPPVGEPAGTPALVAAVETRQAPAQSAPAAPAAEPPTPRNLAAAFADFSLPSGSARIIPPDIEAVDITKIQPRREAPPAAAPPPKPVIPSRQWVQVATGRDAAALAFDWRRIKRSAGGLLDRAEPHLAKWGQTNRLVAGPFASVREADQLIARLKEKEVDSFRFTSAQGEEVKPLD